MRPHQRTLRPAQPRVPQVRSYITCFCYKVGLRLASLSLDERRNVRPAQPRVPQVRPLLPYHMCLKKVGHWECLGLDEDN